MRSTAVPFTWTVGVPVTPALEAIFGDGLRPAGVPLVLDASGELVAGSGLPSERDQLYVGEPG